MELGMSQALRVRTHLDYPSKRRITTDECLFVPFQQESEKGVKTNQWTTVLPQPSKAAPQPVSIE
jgi:hypothetical protein